ncbi:MAG: hypothetical protein LYZ66_04335 [Nitrososphaerales archaeon]|nr:hypothetical protein [Nitrososphaerales archaeon]
MEKTTLELRVVKDNKVLFTVPLEYSGQEEGEPYEYADEEDIEKLASIYSIVANEGRLRMIMELMRRGEMSFSELLKVAMNPKLVRDCMNPMVREGIVIHEKRRAPYRPSFRGMAMATTMITGITKLMEYLEEGGEDLE